MQVFEAAIIFQVNAETKAEADESSGEDRVCKIVGPGRQRIVTVLMLVRVVVVAAVVGGPGGWKRKSGGLELTFADLGSRHAGASGASEGALSLSTSKTRIWSSCLRLRIRPVIDPSHVPPSYEPAAALTLLVCVRLIHPPSRIAAAPAE